MGEEYISYCEHHQGIDKVPDELEVISWDKNKFPHAIQLKDKNRLVVGILNHIERKHDHQKPDIKFLMPDERN